MRKIIVASIIAAVIVGTGSYLINGTRAENTAFAKPVPTATRTATATATVVPTPTPAPPTIVGNRAYTAAADGLHLINTDDGSVVSTFPIGVGMQGGTSAGTSCDGAYAFIYTPPSVGNGDTYSIVRTSDGSTVAGDPALYYGASVQYPCPLRGLGAQFNGGGPVADRAIVVLPDANNGHHIRMFNLTNGQTLYANDSTDGTVVISCSQNTVAVSNLTHDHVDIVRFGDGGVVATIPLSSFVQTCAWN
jgi:hypothetical protein